MTLVLDGLAVNTQLQSLTCYSNGRYSSSFSADFDRLRLLPAVKRCTTLTYLCATDGWDREDKLEAERFVRLRAAAKEQSM